MLALAQCTMYRECIVVRNVGNPEERSFASAPLLISLATHLERIIFRPEIEAITTAAVLWGERSGHDQYRSSADSGVLGFCQGSIPQNRLLASYPCKTCQLKQIGIVE